MMITYHLGIDIGGSNIKYALGDSSGTIHHQSLIPTPTQDLSSFRHALLSLISSVRNDFPQFPLSSIGIASPGTIAIKSGKLNGVNPNLPFWTDIDPALMIESELGIPTFADNDANLMTLAEASQYPDNRVVMGITVGTGIGSGLVVDSQVYRGGSGFAMELGHTSVIPDGDLCNCGLHGCAEAYASLTGIRRRAGLIDPEFSTMGLRELLSVAAIDECVREVILAGEDALCRCIANAVISLDPELVVIGGGCMDGGLYQIESLRQKIQRLLPEVNRGTGIMPAKYGNQAGMIGAILLANTLYHMNGNGNCFSKWAERNGERK